MKKVSELESKIEGLKIQNKREEVECFTSVTKLNETNRRAPSLNSTQRRK